MQFADIMNRVTDMGAISCGMTLYLQINTANIARPATTNCVDYTGSFIYCHIEHGSLLAQKAYHLLEQPMTAAVLRTMIKERPWRNAEAKAKSCLASCKSFFCVSTMCLADHI
jgi:hypothetical protein